MILWNESLLLINKVSITSPWMSRENHLKVMEWYFFNQAYWDKSIQINDSIVDKVIINVMGDFNNSNW